MAAGGESESEHRAHALLAAEAAARVLPLFERERPGDARPRRAVEAAHAWIRGEIGVVEARAAATAADAAAREASSEAARSAARAASFAAASAHVGDRAKRAVAYADRAEREARGAQEAP
ncbi:putative immunity protein [Sinomonas sp. P47F7]|uniref:putative immunity protein n=1 Tax=Sinomonas sp. P47F7 TaxID=3410987 RepID=UPI003BF53386